MSAAGRSPTRVPVSEPTRGFDVPVSFVPRSEPIQDSDIFVPRKGQCPCPVESSDQVTEVPTFVLDELRKQATASVLDPDVWEHVLTEARVPGAEVIVHALRRGVPLTLDDRVLPGLKVPNHPLLYFDLSRVKCSVDKEVRLGRYVQCPPALETFLPHWNAMGVAPRFIDFDTRRRFDELFRKESQLLKAAASDDFAGLPTHSGSGLAILEDNADRVKWRVISDLTYPDGVNANAFVESPYFAMPSAVKFAASLARNSYIWKGDVDSAFRHVPVRERDWPLLAFHVDGKLFVDTRLPFGHRLSPYYWVNFVARPILYVCVARGSDLLGTIAAYVDDFFGGARTKEEAERQMNLWLQVCADLGVPISKAKTFLPTRVLEILGYIINTETMTISLSPERVREVVSELSRIKDRRTVQKRDLESLAGKMVFACSVIPGGRTFMREILDTLRRLRSKHHWAHLSAGFLSDIRWWLEFASVWNGVESIPSPVSVPAVWFSSDAAGGTGIGIFLCGAALHIPLPITLPVPKGDDEALIIAETELIAAVLLIALAAPVFGGKHIAILMDNTNAIGWLTNGTSRRPRAMRCLRVLWRIQARFRVHVTARFIPSEENILADAASRVDVARFEEFAATWLSSNSASLRSHSFRDATSLVLSGYGAGGGAAGLLVEGLVGGHGGSVQDEEEEMAGVLDSVSAFASRFVSQQHSRLHHLPRYRGQEWCPNGVLLDPGLRGLLGKGRVLYSSCPRESGPKSGGEAFPQGSGPPTGQGRGESRALHVGSLGATRKMEYGAAQRPSQSKCALSRSGCVLGLPATGMPAAETSREGLENTVSGRRSNCRQRLGTDHSRVQDHSVSGADPSGGASGPQRPSSVPLARFQSLDDDLVTPIIPDTIKRAVLDSQRVALSFAVSRPRQQGDCAVAAPHWTFLSPRIRASGSALGGAHRSLDASWGLEIARSRNVVCRGLSHSEPPCVHWPMDAGGLDF